MAVRVAGRFNLPAFSTEGFTETVNTEDYPQFSNPWSIQPAGVSEYEPYVGTPVFHVIHEDGTIYGRYYEKDANYWVLAKFYDHMRANPELITQVRELLGGKLLDCSFPNDVECAADALFNIANNPRFA